MAGPEAGRAPAAGSDRLRASHADREHVINVLKAAFIQGRLTKDELDTGVDRTFAARTYANLAAVTADLPPGLIAAPPRCEAGGTRARPPMSKAAKSGICAGIAAVPLAATFLVAVVTGNPMIFFMVVIFYCMALLAAGAQLLDAWHEQRSRGEPVRPARRGLSETG